jgi:hypothetical protein
MRTPYVAFADEANGYNITVMRFTGGAWENVGNAGFSPTAATGCLYTTLAFSGATPYVAFSRPKHGLQGHGDEVRIVLWLSAPLFRE